MKAGVLIFLTLLAAFRGVGMAEVVEGRSEEGRFVIKVHTEPAHPIVGANVVIVTILDGRSGIPLEGVIIEATPWMTIHSHGSSKKTRIKEKGKGLYHVEDVFFTMAGDWDLLLTLRKDAIEDKAIVTFKNVKK